MVKVELISGTTLHALSAIAPPYGKLHLGRDGSAAFGIAASGFG
jgi:hypothetical protein